MSVFCIGTTVPDAGSFHAAQCRARYAASQTTSHSRNTTVHERPSSTHSDRRPSHSRARARARYIFVRRRGAEGTSCALTVPAPSSFSARARARAPLRSARCRRRSSEATTAAPAPQPRAPHPPARCRQRRAPGTRTPPWGGRGGGPKAVHVSARVRKTGVATPGAHLMSGPRTTRPPISKPSPLKLLGVRLQPNTLI